MVDGAQSHVACTEPNFHGGKLSQSGWLTIVPWQI